MGQTVYKKITVYGIVQGVGFRPFIKRLADELGLDGKTLGRWGYHTLKPGTPSDWLKTVNANIKDMQ